MSVAFVKEESAETAAETQLPDRPVSQHPNFVTEAGLKALEEQMKAARAAHELASAVEDVNERRRQSAVPYRDLKYLTDRLRTAQIIPAPETNAVVAFGSTVTFERDDGRAQTWRITGEDEANPASGSVSHVSPLSVALMGKQVGDEAVVAGQTVEIVAVD